MPPTITPTGSLGKALCNLAWLVASSATFQTLVGAVDASHAMASVFVEADDTGPAPRPRALIFFREYLESKVAQHTFDIKADQHLCFEFEPSAGTLASGNVFDQYVEFCNRVDAIRAEMEALEGTGSTGFLAGEGYLAVQAFEIVSGPAAMVETRGAGGAEARAYFFGIEFAVHRRGQ